ncbi:MAG: putative beta-lysine N-acetyltransferase [Verrucomicrobiota bacterium]
MTITCSTASDTIERLPCGAVIQHGAYNDRIYLMQAGSDPSADLPEVLIPMAERMGYSKIFAKIPEARGDTFEQADFVQEGSIPDFYNGVDDALFMAYFLSEDRAREERVDRLNEVRQIAQSKRGAAIRPLDTARFHIKRCAPADVDRMAEIYRSVFPSYPFPIHDPGYLLKTMKEPCPSITRVEHAGALIALSSAEVDRSAAAAEMTDLRAPCPRFRGNGLAVQSASRDGTWDVPLRDQDQLYDRCARSPPE